MALPKEPRQKMINMMYLVLTALLALNVSAEILNAFKTVNTSIDNANRVLVGNNNAIYSSFTEKISDPKTREKAERWKPKADKAAALAKEVYDKIDVLKVKIRKASGLKDGGKDNVRYEGDMDGPTRVMNNE